VVADGRLQMLPGAGSAAPAGGALTKALIIDTTTGAQHAVMYNPDELKLEQANAYAEIAIPGRNASPVQFIRGKARALSMELLFDTYELRPVTDVRAFTEPIVELLNISSQTASPPILLFSLGALQFRCVLVEAGLRFTMFLRDGTPVRATMSVRLQEYVEVTTEIRQGLFFGSPTVSAVANAVIDRATGSGLGTGVVHVVGQGDTLSGLAGTYLGDPAAWRIIATANGILDPLHLSTGTALVIPPGGSRR
jgi:hypothetical protein